MKKSAAILTILILALAAFFIFQKFYKGKVAWPQVRTQRGTHRVLKVPDLYFVSEKKIFSYTRPGPAKQIFELEEAATAQIHSILPSPKRDFVAVIIKDGKLVRDESPSFVGDIKLVIVDSDGQPKNDYLLFQKEKIASLVYFWQDKNIFIRANIIDDKGDVSRNFWQAEAEGHSLNPIASGQYDELMNSNQLEIIFTDFVTSAFRKSNQTKGGDSLSIDRNLITRTTAKEIVPVFEASKFFVPADSLFNTFQVSPDEKNIAFNKDTDQCKWISKALDIKFMNQLFVYNFESGKQAMVVAHNSPLNFIWIDNNTLAFDQGLENKQEVFLYSMDSGKLEQITDNQISDGLFFENHVDCLI